MAARSPPAKGTTQRLASGINVVLVCLRVSMREQTFFESTDQHHHETLTPEDLQVIHNPGSASILATFDSFETCKARLPKIDSSNPFERRIAGLKERYMDTFSNNTSRKSSNRDTDFSPLVDGRPNSDMEAVKSTPPASDFCLVQTQLAIFYFLPYSWNFSTLRTDVFRPNFTKFESAIPRSRGERKRKSWKLPIVTARL